MKRIVKREKREAAQREAQKAAEAFLQISPRKAPGRIRGLSVDASGPPSAGTTPPPEVSSQGSSPTHTDSRVRRIKGRATRTVRAKRSHSCLPFGGMEAGNVFHRDCLAVDACDP